jgi:hypothetical protein
LTLVDIGILHEQVASGLLTPTNRETFYDLMLNESDSFYINSVIDQEAVVLGLTETEVADFKSQTEMAHKGGSYTLVPEGGLREYRSLAGWIELPFACENVPEEYVYGTFVHRASSLDTQNTGSDLSIFEVGRELLRPPIQIALESSLCARPPQLNTPASLVVECNTFGGVPGDDSQILNWTEEAFAEDECDDVLVSHSPLPGLFEVDCPFGNTPVTFTTEDECGNVTEQTEVVTVLDTTSPQIFVPEPIVLECNAPGGVEANDPEVVAWLNSSSGMDICTEVSLSNDAPDLFPVSCENMPTTVVFTATDECDNGTEDTSALTVVDTTPPEVTCEVALDTLWPANHKFVDVGLSFALDDVCDTAPDVEIIVTSDEATATEKGAGGKTHCPDAIIGDDFSVQLRAERSGTGDGRVYEITVNATDGCGNIGTCQVQVAVLHDKSDGMTVDSGQVFDTTICN